MAASERNELRNLVYARAKALQTEAIRSGGSIPAEQFEELRQLAALAGIYDAARPVPPQRRWPVVALFVFTLVLVSILLFVRRRSTEIELDLHVTELGFVLPERQLLNEPLRLAALGILGLREIQLPRSRSSEAVTLTSGHDFESGINLTVATENQSRGEVGLPELIVPAETHVSFKKTDLPGQYRWALQGAGFDLRADVVGPVRVDAEGGTERQLTFLSPKPVLFEPQANDVNLDLTFLVLPQNLSPVPRNIKDLSFLRIENRRGPDGLPVRRVSTIQSGSIYLEELNGQELKLRPGEEIRFESAQGEIESLELEDDGVVFQFRGRVHRMTAGSTETSRSLMPTWLDWLKARRGLYLLWGTAVYLFGLIAGVLRWLKVSG
jgi:hypothetical protein